MTTTSYSPRDIAVAVTDAGLTVNRQQIQLDHPIKSLGLTEVRVVLHPEVVIRITANVARSPEDAERQARGEQVGRDDGDEDEADAAEGLFEGTAPEFESTV